MKKRVLLLSAAGIAAGLVYALESNRSKQRARHELPDVGESSSNKKRSTTSASNSDGSFEQDPSTAKFENVKTSSKTDSHQLDDHGTNQADASRILKEIRDTAFDASNEKLGLALGRPPEEIVQGINGAAPIDSDVVLKARALAMQRGLELE